MQFMHCFVDIMAEEEEITDAAGMETKRSAKLTEREHWWINCTGSLVLGEEY